MKTTFGVLLASVLVMVGAGASVLAQAPPGQDQMTVTGQAPVQPGTEIRIEALDPVAIRGVTCARALTTPAPDHAAGRSRFEVTVSRSCFARLSENLRVCWNSTDCAGVDFRSGQTIDLGTLTAKIFPANAPPETGFGTEDSRAGGIGTAKTMGSILAAVGFAGLLSALWLRRRSRGRAV